MPRIKETWIRHVVGFIVAPLVPPAVISLIPNPAGWSPWIFEIALMFTVPTLVVVGAPLHFYFRRRGWTSAAAYAGIGACCGAVADFIIEAPRAWQAVAEYQSGTWAPNVVLLLFLCFLGLPAGLAFWLIVRPDRAYR
jgi:hypothetical protein